MQNIRACLPTRHYPLMSTIGCSRIINEDFARYIMTDHPLEILVRSSGVELPGDFLMWQV